MNPTIARITIDPSEMTRRFRSSPRCSSTVIELRRVRLRRRGIRGTGGPLSGRRGLAPRRSGLLGGLLLRKPRGSLLDARLRLLVDLHLQLLPEVGGGATELPQ